MSKEQYKKFIKSIEISDMNLASLECAQNMSYPSKSKENIDISLENKVVKVEHEGIYLNIQLEFNVVAFNNDDTVKSQVDIIEEDKLFHIYFVLNLVYKLELDTLDSTLKDCKTEIDRFVNKNVVINAWPYARELISSTTTRMGFPALVIPTYKRY